VPQSLTPDLSNRALMYYNRDREKAARYLRKHQGLQSLMAAKGVCSDETRRQG
jgi:hypothetical protein